MFNMYNNSSGTNISEYCQVTISIWNDSATFQFPVIANFNVTA